MNLLKNLAVAAALLAAVHASEKSRFCYVYVSKMDFGYVPKENVEKRLTLPVMFAVSGDVDGTVFYLKTPGNYEVYAIDPADLEPVSVEAGSGKTIITAVKERKKEIAGISGKRYVAVTARKGLIYVIDSAEEGFGKEIPVEIAFGAALADGKLWKISYCRSGKDTGLRRTNHSFGTAPAGAVYVPGVSFSECDSMGVPKKGGKFVCLYDSSTLAGKVFSGSGMLVFPYDDPMRGYFEWRYDDDENPYLLPLKDNPSAVLCFERIGLSNYGFPAPVFRCGEIELMSASEKNILRKKALKLRYGYEHIRLGDGK